MRTRHGHERGRGRDVRGIAAKLAVRTPRSVVAVVERHPRLKGHLRTVSQKLLGRQHVAAVVRDGEGEGLYLVIDTYTEKFLWSGVHEPHLQQTLRDLLAPGKTFWDIGAHIGFFAFQAARHGARVVAYEPFAPNAARLREGAALNHFATQLTVVDAAMSATPGSATLQEGDVSSFTWSLADRPGSASTAPVQVTTLDEQADQRGIPDLVKIDTEGVELDVLRGGEQLIARRATSFIVEITDEPDAARQLLPNYEWRLLGQNHWLATP